MEMSTNAMSGRDDEAARHVRILAVSQDGCRQKRPPGFRNGGRWEENGSRQSDEMDRRIGHFSGLFSATLGTGAAATWMLAIRGSAIVLHSAVPRDLEVNGAAVSDHAIHGAAQSHGFPVEAIRQVLYSSA